MLKTVLRLNRASGYIMPQSPQSYDSAREAFSFHASIVHSIHGSSSRIKRWYPLCSSFSVWLRI